MAKVAAVLVYAGTFVAAFTAPIDFDNLWMGDPMGKTLYLTESWFRGEKQVLDLGRDLAAELRGARVR